MSLRFSAHQMTLNTSECERLCRCSSRDVEDLARRSGWHGLPGEPVRVSVGAALNMVIHSTAMSYGVELGAMNAWIPGLRNEALLKMGERVANWSFNGAGDHERQFWEKLYGGQDAIRPYIASLLSCCTNVTTRQFRYISQTDVECISGRDHRQIQSGRAPKFTIDSHELAERVEAAYSGPMFIVRDKPHTLH